MKKLIALIFLPILAYGQAITQSQTIVLPAQALRDSLGIWVTIPAGRSILAPLLAPPSGTSGYWKRNFNAGESGTLTPTTATDTIKAPYFNASTRYIGGSTGTASAPSYGISGQTNNMGMYPASVTELAFSTNNTRVFRANTTNFVTDVSMVPNSDGGYNLGSATLNWNYGFFKSLRVGTGATQNPLHVLVGVSAVAGNLNAFNFVNSDINTNRSTVAEATDTSSVNLEYSSTGNPTLTMKSKAGASIFKVDSNAVYAPAYRYNTGIFSAATSDGSDNSYVGISGGGSDGGTRGATIYLSGNERGAFEGEVAISTGTVATQGSVIQLKTGTSGLARMRIDEVGVVTLGTTDSSGTGSFYAGKVFASTNFNATAIADPAAVAGNIWLSSTNADVLKYSNASSTFNVLSTKSSTLTGTPADPTGTTSTTAVMMGLNQTITPAVSTRLLITICGQMANNTINDGATVQVRYGTGTAPTNGAALTGTQLGASQTFTALVAAQKDGFSITGIATGLTIGTAYWIDAALNVVTGGTATVTGITVTASEL